MFKIFAPNSVTFKCTTFNHKLKVLFFTHHTFIRRVQKTLHLLHFILKFKHSCIILLYIFKRVIALTNKQIGKQCIVRFTLYTVEAHIFVASKFHCFTSYRNRFVFTNTWVKISIWI